VKTTLRSVLVAQRREVGGALVPLPGHPGEETLVVAALVLQLAGGEHELHGGAGHHVAPHLVVQRLQGDQHRRTGVLEQVGELPRAAHRVDRDHHAAGLPGREHADQELRHVLQVDREPVAGGEAVREEPAGERVALGVELLPAQDPVEVRHRDPRRIGRQPGAEHLQRARVLGLDLARLVAVQVEPGSLVVDAHGAAT